MGGMPANSVDTIITDPPYGLEFMGKDWDRGVPGVRFWQAALRVAKPGAIMLAFGGTRTFHRLACAIEDAGWEIRDTLMWVYGSGFPKSHDISKAIDKVNGETDRALSFTRWMRSTGMKSSDIDKITGTYMGGHYTTEASQPQVPTRPLFEMLRPHIKVEIPEWVETLIDRVEAEREVIGKDTKARSTTGKSALPTVGGETIYESWDITAPATPAARLWQGYGTALKPSFEPVILAQKPIDGTYAHNAVKWGVAGMNIDGGRVKGENTQGAQGSDGQDGRWPANFIHDGSDEVLAGMPQTKSGNLSPGHGAGNNFGVGNTDKRPRRIASPYGGDSGSAARFFYCAKASKCERDAGLDEGEHSGHPTVKPLALMRYLCRLTRTPTGGVVLDPFMGSGSTGCAAVLEGRDFIGIEMDLEYVEIARRRIEHWGRESDAEVEVEQASFLVEV